MAKKIRFGIMGCGNIAGSFAGDLPLTKYCELTTVASRSQEKANKFAKQYKSPKAYNSYQQLVEDPEVDVVYVATPHPFHMENSMLAINAGKHVLCEKPITVSAGQLKKLIAAAKKNNVFLMEAMWTRFFPAMAKLRKLLAEDKVGKIMTVEADFGVKFDAGPEHRIFNPELGGGALLDLGIYPVALASMIYGKQPKKIFCAASFHSKGVDDHTALTFEYDETEFAILGCSSKVSYKQQARIYGEKGMIIVNEKFSCPTNLSLRMNRKQDKTFEFANPGIGLFYEADHVANCIKKGMLDSDIMPLAESLEIQKTMDKIRAKW